MVFIWFKNNGYTHFTWISSIKNLVYTYLYLYLFLISCRKVNKTMVSCWTMSGDSSASEAQFATVAFRTGSLSTASSVPQLLNYTLLERDTFDETPWTPMQTSMWTEIALYVLGASIINVDRILRIFDPLHLSFTI